MRTIFTSVLCLLFAACQTLPHTDQASGMPRTDTLTLSSSQTSATTLFESELMGPPAPDLHPSQKIWTERDQPFSNQDWKNILIAIAFTAVISAALFGGHSSRGPYVRPPPSNCPAWVLNLNGVNCSLGNCVCNGTPPNPP